VSYEEALKHVSNPDDFALRFRGIESTSDSEWTDFAGEGESGDESEKKPENDGVDSLDEDDFSIDRF
jgi:twitching motility protein PilT